eukprot:2134439-Prymnesium_polylepis.1
MICGDLWCCGRAQVLEHGTEGMREQAAFCLTTLTVEQVPSTRAPRTPSASHGPLDPHDQRLACTRRRPRPTLPSQLEPHLRPSTFNRTTRVPDAHPNSSPVRPLPPSRLLSPAAAALALALFPSLSGEEEDGDGAISHDCTHHAAASEQALSRQDRRRVRAECAAAPPPNARRLTAPADPPTHRALRLDSRDVIMMQWPCTKRRERM